MPPALTFTEWFARNFRAARAAAGHHQGDVSERMNGLGFKEWRRQTVARVERGERRVSAEEAFWLAYVLDTSVARLMSPTEDDHWVAAPNGKTIHAQHARQRMRSTGDAAIQWHDNTPEFMPDHAGWIGPGVAAESHDDHGT
jgi:transcriptional regulator with XRE-family HTH domain